RTRSADPPERAGGPISRIEGAGLRMNDLTDLIERATADQPPLSITRQSAVAAGRRALRRRRQGTAVLGIVAVAAVAAGVTAVPHFRGTGASIGGHPRSWTPLTYR